MATMLRSLLALMLSTLFLSHIPAERRQAQPNIAPRWLQAPTKTRPTLPPKLPALWSGRLWGPPRLCLRRLPDAAAAPLVIAVAHWLTLQRSRWHRSPGGTPRTCYPRRNNPRKRARLSTMSALLMATTWPSLSHPSHPKRQRQRQMQLRRYCCTGSFGSPNTCKPTAYSRIFKTACPKAYSYAYDDPTSISTCTGGNYLLTFCPHRR
uniref:Thaumatin-like protein n=1 Tax=Fagus sylvatica TaxID=28930 RepID=A0A2N9FEU6_FAGSY